MTTRPACVRGSAVLGCLLALAGCGTSTGVTSEPSEAALALECDGTPYNGGGADNVDHQEPGDTAEAALAGFLDAEAGAYALPTEGYRLEQEDGGRALFSYDVGRRTKVAVVLAPGLAGETGWGVEGWAQCDPAELPGAFTERADIGVWTDADGRRVPTSVVKSFQGEEHCEWQHITFLHWHEADELVQYVGPGADELSEWLRTSYDGAAAVPDDARATGFRRDGRELWLTEEADAAYLVNVDDPTDVERWPAARSPILCR